MGKQWKQWQTIFLGSKITADGDCSHEIKRCLLLGRKVMTSLAAAAAAKSLQSCLTLCDPTRLRSPWDSPGKNTGVGCHFLLQCIKVKSESEVAQLCPTLCDPMDCSLPAPPSMGFSRQEYWSGLPLPSPIEKSSNLWPESEQALLIGLVRRSHLVISQWPGYDYKFFLSKFSQGQPVRVL